MLMFTGTQVLAHFIGDYLLQSGWMAEHKVKRSSVALIHALVYSLPFVVLLHPSLAAYAVIMGTHFAIDRWQLARYLGYAKEFLSPPSTWKPWSESGTGGLPKTTSPVLAVWLGIIYDNTLHLVINALALSYL